MQSSIEIADAMPRMFTCSMKVYCRESFHKQIALIPTIGPSVNCDIQLGFVQWRHTIVLDSIEVD